jgi:hypothetical protein
VGADVAGHHRHDPNNQDDTTRARHQRDCRVIR